MASKNKVMAYLLGKYVDFLTQRVTFYKSRTSLYADFEVEHLKDIDDAANRKIELRIAKNARLYATADYEASDKKEVFEGTSKLEIAAYQKKLRMRYRIEREKARRAIAKLAEEDKSGEQIKLIDQNLASFEASLAEELEAYKAKRHIAFEKSLERDLSKAKPTAQELEALKSRLTADNETYTAAVNAKREAKRAKFVRSNKARIAKLEGKLNNFQAKLKVQLERIQQDSYALPEGVILRAENLCMFFGGVKAVNDLTFDVKQGEIFGLIGPNGAGKTTVFNCITQFNKPTSGHLYLRNRLDEVVNLNKLAVHNVILQGIVRTFQNLEVVKEVSVLDNLLIAAHRQYQSNFFIHMLHLPILRLEEKVIRARADKILAFMGLSLYRDWYAWGLPYGVLKKIEIARTLMADPHLIILDEPAAGLNDSETVELANLIRRIRDEYKCTILLVEHDMGLVMDVCDNILAISFGKKLAQGSAKEIQSNKDVQAAYLGAPEEVER